MTTDPKFIGLVRLVTLMVVNTARCRIRSHDSQTDEDGYLFCPRCGQSLTPEGKALGWLVE